MSYYPYLRGKQNELLTVKENATLIAESNFIPIIEPVKNDFKSLGRTLNAICDARGEVVIVLNPQYGSSNHSSINSYLDSHFSGRTNIIRGINLHETIQISEVDRLLEIYDIGSIIHSGFTEARALSERIGRNSDSIINVFIEKFCGRLYRRHFRDHEKKVLIRDGFEKRPRNSDHPPSEFFSDLHATFAEEGVSGFGDFLIVGDNFSTSGGPAYTVAIHLTYVDRRKDEEMHIHHFKSIRQDTPQDPAGKFGEALEALLEVVDHSGSQIENTRAIQEFRDLNNRGHFPGLGYVKKLSMNHHIETLASYLG